MKLTSDDIKWNEGKDYAVVSDLGGVYQYSHSIANVEYAMFMITLTNNYIVKREPLINSNIKCYPSFSHLSLADAAKRAVLRMKSAFNGLGRLTSDQIKWKSNATYAIVAIDDNVVEEQINFNPSLNIKSFTNVGAYGYGGVFHYQVKRELKQVKPTVSHCVRVYSDGSTGVIGVKFIYLSDVINGAPLHPHTHHHNGKQKFRLVYKES